MARRLTLDFLKTEAASGLILATAAVVAVILANSPWRDAYFAFVKAPFTIQFGAFEETKSVLKWTKDGLMAVFFFTVGMEIKYEILRGELSNMRKLAMPVFAAIGGMAVPALVYLAFNLGEGGSPTGWPIPAATDIAFALAALAIAAPKAPTSLRVFLLTLAIADDLGAVALIAILFTSDLNLLSLAGAAAGLGVLTWMGRWKSIPPLLFAAVFLVVWVFTLESGVNTSLAGVAAALTVPIAPRRPGEEGVLKHYMHSLHPYVAYGILPFFAFVAAGFSFDSFGGGDGLLAPLPLGILAGLALGKPIGVFGAAFLTAKLKLGQPPSGAGWLELLGVSMLCGVGFTMSLFIGGLAFPAGNATAEVQLGVIAGSILSVLLGVLTLKLAEFRQPRQ
ncbi:Na+/H+ antiporter NhaA [Caulobacter mirabilis]|uniref:Na(+)/H(+) antiporter NhaA n=1 Tax=Caulobacter mirabilis TaxID=69666 RepID=A0A2D2B1H8_9CAUL|nr:Na+/H+ antiporter NhaA [Caulobacter mirabilis]ATQ44067.1 Na+/H+ antiporter NhaA [Caulobacter mirabilis]